MAGKELAALAAVPNVLRRLVSERDVALEKAASAEAVVSQSALAIKVANRMEELEMFPAGASLADKLAAVSNKSVSELTDTLRVLELTSSDGSGLRVDTRHRSAQADTDSENSGMRLYDSILG